MAVFNRVSLSTEYVAGIQYSGVYFLKVVGIVQRQPNGISWLPTGVSWQPNGVSWQPTGVSWQPTGVSWLPQEL